MKKKIIITIISSIIVILSTLVIIAVTKNNRFQQVYQQLEITFTGNDSFDNITSDFVLPSVSSVNSKAILTWESDNLDVLQINDNQQVSIYPRKKDVLVKVTLKITLNKQTKSYDYNFLVKKAINHYVKFYVDDLLIRTIIINHNDQVTKPTDPYKEGHTFTGWKMNDVNYNFNDLVTSDLELHASFLEDLKYSYKVIYLFQNIFDNEYEEKDFEYFQTTFLGLNEINPKEITGFKLALNQTFVINVTNDNLAVISLYYDREIYEVKIDNNITYYRYLEPLKSLDEPYRLGYEFERFSIELPEVVTTNLEIVSIFKPANVKYQINHYLENIHDEDYTLYESENLLALTGSLIYPNVLTIEHYLLDLTNLDQFIVLADSSLVIDLYYDLERISINFFEYSNYNRFVKYGNYLTKPEDPSKVGYIFKEWTLDDHYFDFNNTPITKELTLVALFTAGDASYQINYYANELDTSIYTNLIDKVMIAGTTDELISVDVKDFYGYTLKEGQDFNNYYLLADSSLEINIYYDRNKYNITFDDETKEYEYLSLLEIPLVSVDVGYTSTWDKEVSLIVTKDETYTHILKALMVSYQVVHEIEQLDGTYLVVETQNLLAYTDSYVVVSPLYETSHLPLFDVLENYLILGDGSLVINLKYRLKTYNINLNGINNEYKHGQQVIFPQIVILENEIFEGWFDSLDQIIDHENYLALSNAYLTARKRLANSYVITYLRGTFFPVVEVIYEHQLHVFPSSLEVSGYHLKNVTYQGNVYEFNHYVTTDMTLDVSYQKIASAMVVSKGNINILDYFSDAHEIYYSSNNIYVNDHLLTGLNLSLSSIAKLYVPIEYYQKDTMIFSLYMLLNNHKLYYVEFSQSEVLLQEEVLLNVNKDEVNLLFNYNLLTNNLTTTLFTKDHVYLLLESAFKDITSDFTLDSSDELVFNHDSLVYHGLYKHYLFVNNELYFLKDIASLYSSFDLTNDESSDYVNISKILTEQLMLLDIFYISVGNTYMTIYFQDLSYIIISLSNISMRIYEHKISDDEVIYHHHLTFVKTNKRLLLINEDLEITILDDFDLKTNVISVGSNFSLLEIDGNYAILEHGFAEIVLTPITDETVIAMLNDILSVDHYTNQTIIKTSTGIIVIK